MLKADIEAGRIPGAVIAIARRGKLVTFDAYGFRDKAANVPMTTDTIFNIASMTKPMTAVGALMLYEQGKLLIDDPLSKYFPKFASMGVAMRRQWRADRRNRAGQPPDHHPGPDAPHLGHHLWRPRQHAGAQDVSGRQQRRSAATMTARLHRQAGLVAVAASARHGVGLWLRPRRARSHHREGERAVARAISADQPVRAARHDRHRVLDVGRQGGRVTPSRCRSIPTPASRRRAAPS